MIQMLRPRENPEVFKIYTPTSAADVIYLASFWNLSVGFLPHKTVCHDEWLAATTNNTVISDAEVTILICFM